MNEKSLFIKIGDFFFKTRNFVFPLILAIIFLLASPPNTLFGSEYLEDLKDVFAIAIGVLGLACRGIVIGFAYIKRGGLNKKVYADKLVTEGMFNLCRNPLYVGNMLIYTGIFLLHGNPYVIIGGISLFFFIYQSIIAAEEYFLRSKFGDDYVAYCKQVSRWIPNVSKFSSAIEGMDFSIKRIIVKDYSTMATTFGIMLLLTSYENLVQYPLAEVMAYTYIIAALFLLNIGLALSVRYLKKRGAFGTV